MKKFMFLEQRLVTSKVTVSNANLYGLASLLISNKFENIDGNFLANISYIADREDSSVLDKKCILECEVYIISVLLFLLRFFNFILPIAAL
jgi:hypothetical protein